MAVQILTDLSDSSANAMLGRFAVSINRNPKDFYRHAQFPIPNFPKPFSHFSCKYFISFRLMRCRALSMLFTWRCISSAISM